MRRLIVVQTIILFILLPLLTIVSCQQKPAPTPAPAPAPIPSTQKPEASPEVLYTHDFSSEVGSGWDTYADETGSIFYEGGALHVKANVYTEHDAVSMYNMQEFSDFALEVETALVDGTDDNCHEIMFRDQSAFELNYYAFVISADGYYGGGKFVNNEMIEIIPMTRSIHINKGRNAINLVRVECIGDNLRMIVNDNLLIDIVDSSFSSGYIGLGAVAWEEQDGKDYSEVIYDNIIITGLQ